MKEYLDSLKYIMENGVDKSDRTGVGTRSIFGHQMRFNLQKGFPAVTTKKLAFKSVVSELLWFLEGSTDERRLAEIHFGKPREELIGKQTIWTANADAQGKALGYTNTDTVKELGPVYGAQWRKFGGIESGDWGTDQISWIINEIKTNPNSRRLIVSAWSPNQIHEMALPPCHTMFQFYVTDGKLSCQLYQRSADFVLGSPFNIASYALFTHMIAQICDLSVGDFVYTIGDMHIYHNHFDGVSEQLSRQPMAMPNLWLNPEIKNIFDFTINDIKLIDYNSHDKINFEMAV
jgi:thymidylate synthase